MNPSMATWTLIALLALGAARAQEEPTPDAPAAEQNAPAPHRDFKPSQDVSPDQEVDFPADI